MNDVGFSVTGILFCRAYEPLLSHVTVQKVRKSDVPALFDYSDDGEASERSRGNLSKCLGRKVDELMPCRTAKRRTAARTAFKHDKHLEKLEERDVRLTSSPESSIDFAPKFAVMHSHGPNRARARDRATAPRRRTKNVLLHSYECNCSERSTGSSKESERLEV